MSGAGAAGVGATTRRSITGPLIWGVAGALALLLLYLGIISFAESFSHALRQLRTDAPWVSLVSAGFGLQLGLFARLRQLVRGNRAGTGAVTGVGTGTSTAGMVACCAHHLVDLAPFLGLSAATAFLGRYRLWFIVIGLAVNALGVAMSVVNLRKATVHLAA